MKQRMLHTPEGVRDIYNIESRQKSVLQNELNKTLKLYGFQDIQTPTFEYADIFSEEIGSIESKELYRFFDREGNMLALRPDITPSIARATATLFTKKELPAKLCYVGNTFINHSSYQGRLKENTQLGAEVIGLDSVEADAEMLAMVVNCLKNTGLEDFQINVGHVGYYNSLINSVSLDEATTLKVSEFIENKNYFGVDELLKQAHVSSDVSKSFHMLSELIGGVEMLDKAAKYAVDEKALSSVERLKEIAKLLELYGVLDYITFDFSMIATYDYYTGIVFKGYTYGTGDAIVTGGRYDQLLKHFGADEPAIGFAIILGELFEAISRQKIEIKYEKDNHIIIYDACMQVSAIKLANNFRKGGKVTQILKKDESKSIEDYVTYGMQNFGKNLLYLQEGKKMEMINLRTGERTSLELSDENK